MKHEPLIRLQATVKDPGVCKGCYHPIVWMLTVAGHKMPMNEGAAPRHVFEGVEVYASSDAHWASCPARDMFQRKRGARPR
jgi:hypothetical protein